MVGTKWHRASRLAMLIVLASGASLAIAQPPAPFNERDVERQTNIEDKPDIWVLDFRFKDPRLITVDIPGRGRKVVWYLWYQVINRDPKRRPHLFIPDFELVTHDRKGVYHDRVLPTAQRAIQRLEDPTGRLDIKNSVTIASEPIPPSPDIDDDNAFPRAVTGVATWDDVDPDANRYSIFVSGLSNGWSEDDNKVIRRKTLQLNFRRVGDRYNMRSSEIKFVPPAQWIYRATNYSRPPDKPDANKQDKAANLFQLDPFLINKPR
ncbi:MAG: hypothetical protein KatS3mg105_0799 [Gemmatales bacterium]|nr:MAG: hypothetical protein KatS3mg105_0799 [Gemmatales bacterium]